LPGRGPFRVRSAPFQPTYVSIRPHTSAYVGIRQHTSAYVSIRQHTSTQVSNVSILSTRQHTSAYLRPSPNFQSTSSVALDGYMRGWRPVGSSTCIRQHTSAYVSLRQHTSAYAPQRRRLCSLSCTAQSASGALNHPFAPGRASCVSICAYGRMLTYADVC
jgi:hypothetical protein